MTDYNIAGFNSYALGGSFNDNNGVSYTYKTSTSYTYYSSSGNPQTIVGDGAFSTSNYATVYNPNFIYLTNFSFGNSVTSLGIQAFYGTGLTNITIPSTIQTVGVQAVRRCRNLTDAIVENTYIPDGMFVECSSLKNVLISNVTSLGTISFANCGSLTSFTIPNTVTSMAYGVFYGSGIESITIPSSVITFGDRIFDSCSNLKNIDLQNYSIGVQTFNRCSSLTNVKLGHSIKSIGYAAFAGCTNLPSIEIPASVTEIGNAVFYACSKLSTIIVDSNNETYSNYSGDSYGVLYNKSITTLLNYPIGNTSDTYDIPNGVISIDYSSFYTCTNLLSITLPDTVINLGQSCFHGTGIESITIPSSVTNGGSQICNNCQNLKSATLENNAIYNYMFLNCQSLTNINIGPNVTSIGNYAFDSCSNLSSVTLPDSMSSIGNNAFFRCSSLSTINFPNSLKNIGSYSLSLCGFTNITLPSTLSVVDPSCFSTCRNLNSVTIENDNVSQYMFRNCTSLTTVNLGDSLTSIDGGGFGGCSALTNITFPKNLNTIREHAFGGTALESITVPSTLINMGSYAFGGCGKLTDIILQNNFVSFKMFYACSSLTNVEIGENVVNISSYGFFSCTSLSTITIPKTVNAMGSHVFSGCSSLTSLIFSNHNLPSFDPNVFSDAPIQQLIVYVSAYYKKINEYNKAKLESLGILPDNIVFTSSTCFLTGSKILTDKGYIPIEDLRKGHMVKTLKNDYLPIVLIGKSVIHNYGDDKRILDRLYKLTPDKYPELIEDLVITGNHSILVDTLTPFQEEQILASYGKFKITDDKVRLEAYLDDKALPYEEKGLFVTYHLALENKNNSYNYGIWANGLLVETCSKRYLLLISGMELIK